MQTILFWLYLLFNFINGDFYHFFNQDHILVFQVDELYVSFNDANDYCLDTFGTTLASFSSEDELINFLQLADNHGWVEYPHWIGLHCNYTNFLNENENESETMDNSECFEWIDGSAFEISDECIYDLGSHFSRNEFCGNIYPRDATNPLNTIQVIRDWKCNECDSTLKTTHKLVSNSFLCNKPSKKTYEINTKIIFNYYCNDNIEFEICNSTNNAWFVTITINNSSSQIHGNIEIVNASQEWTNETIEIFQCGKHGFQPKFENNNRLSSYNIEYSFTSEMIDNVGTANGVNNLENLEISVTLTNVENDHIIIGDSALISITIDELVVTQGALSYKNKTRLDWISNLINISSITFKSDLGDDCKEPESWFTIIYAEYGTTFWFGISTLFGLSIPFAGQKYATKFGYETYDIKKVIGFVLYSLDVASDILWAMHAAIEYHITTNATKSAMIMIILCVSITSIIVPFISSVFALLYGILKHWQTDKDCWRIVGPWLLNYTKWLIFLTFICGNSFSAVELCNTHLFGLKMFNMGLPSRLAWQYKNYRFLCVVLLENIPQIICQIFFCIVTNKIDTMTIISTIFSSLNAVITSIASYLNWSYRKYEKLIKIKFTLIADDISGKGSSDVKKLKNLYKYRKKMAIEIASILKIEPRTVDVLKPIIIHSLIDKGVEFTIYISYGENNNNNNNNNNMYDKFAEKCLNQFTEAIKQLTFKEFFKDKCHLSAKPNITHVKINDVSIDAAPAGPNSPRIESFPSLHSSHSLFSVLSGGYDSGHDIHLPSIRMSNEKNKSTDKLRLEPYFSKKRAKDDEKELASVL